MHAAAPLARVSHPDWKSIMIFRVLAAAVLLLGGLSADAQQKNVRDYGIAIGVLQPGKWNAITDVPKVEVGQKTLVRGDDVRTGVTAILPYAGNIFQGKVPAAVYVGPPCAPCRRS